MVVVVRLEGDVEQHEEWARSVNAVYVGAEEDENGTKSTLVLLDTSRGSTMSTASHPGVAAGTCQARVTRMTALAPNGFLLRESPSSAPPPPELVTAEGFKPLAAARSMAKDGKPDAVVIVDPISTGARIASMAQERGFLIIRVFSLSMPEEIQNMVPQGCSSLDWYMTLQCGEDVTPTIEKLKSLEVHILGVLIGCEAGVERYDQLTSEWGGFPTNGIEGSLARRDKYPMGEKVRRAGIRAVKQHLCSDWAEAEPYITNELGVSTEAAGRWCVLKPCKSAGTDGVFISKSLDEAKMRFAEIVGCENVFGEKNTSVLVQEFMAGREFVVDSVSVEGVHKCTAIWVYDKRPANGAQFVYYAMTLFQSEDGKREEALVNYVHSVLDALDVRHGPSHAEVMWLDSDDAPCLVEVGCRPHGGEGTFVDMTTPVIGYNQASVMLDALEKPYRFHRLPKRPEPYMGHALEVCLVCYEEGTFMGWDERGLATIRALPSFDSLELKIHKGESITPTVDFINTPGSVMLCHTSDRAQVEQDSEVIRSLEKTGLYHITPVPNRKLRLASF